MSGSGVVTVCSANVPFPRGFMKTKLLANELGDRVAKKLSKCIHLSIGYSIHVTTELTVN
jgi:hypothetical protein